MPQFILLFTPAVTSSTNTGDPVQPQPYTSMHVWLPLPCLREDVLSHHCTSKKTSNSG